jgi:signal transduction histidine kinase
MSPGSGIFSVARDAEGKRWRLYTVPVTQPPGGYLVAEAPLDQIDAFISSFRQLVGTLALVGIVVTIAASWLVARSSLRPVDALTGAATAITRSRGFSRRVPEPRRRDELGRLATTFNEMLGSLEEAYRAEQRFVADASHELRAPLTAIQANLELVKRRPDLPESERQEAIDEALRESHRLSTLVADLLALARADAGVSLRMERVELDRVLLESTGQARNLARGQRLEVGTLQPAMVMGDRDRLKQLLLILLDNALKYTPSGGAVTVELIASGKVAELRVRDTGVGIDSEDLPKLFDRFYRADKARARDPGGTGLGLSIARWIVEQHRGAIRLESAPGRGTTAVVTLPLSAVPRTQLRLSYRSQSLHTFPLNFTLRGRRSPQ